MTRGKKIIKKKQNWSKQRKHHLLYSYDNYK